MDLNLHLAAYGMFQHQFAYLDGSLTKAIAALMKCDPEVARPLAKRLEFGKRLKLIGDLNLQLESAYDLGMKVSGGDVKPPGKTVFQELRDWIDKAGALSRWRNDRVHGRLGLDETTGAAYLVDQNGSVLDVDYAACTAKGLEAYQLVDELEDITKRCLEDVKLTQNINAILK